MAVRRKWEYEELKKYLSENFPNFERLVDYKEAARENNKKEDVPFLPISVDLYFKKKNEWVSTKDFLDYESKSEENYVSSDTELALPDAPLDEDVQEEVIKLENIIKGKKEKDEETIKTVKVKDMEIFEADTDSFYENRLDFEKSIAKSSVFRKMLDDSDFREVETDKFKVFFAHTNDKILTKYTYYKRITVNSGYSILGQFTLVKAGEKFNNDSSKETLIFIFFKNNDTEDGLSDGMVGEMVEGILKSKSLLYQNEPLKIFKLPDYLKEKGKERAEIVMDNYSFEAFIINEE